MARKEDLVTPDMGAVDSDNPNGKYLNKDTGIPGTPVLAQERNSDMYFFARLMAAAGLSYDGDVDTFTSSQFFDALINTLNGGAPVPKWDSTEAALYETAGYLVQDAGGKHYASSGKALNENKDPADPANVDYWFPSPGAALLEQYCKEGKMLSGMHIITDRANALYQTSMLIDRIRKGSTLYNLHLVALDGSTVTGNATLEALMLTHPHVTKFAPDSGGTLTLIDSGERVDVGQSSGGESDTMGEVQEDRMQGHYTKLSESGGAANNANGTVKTVTGSVLAVAGLLRATAGTEQNIAALEPITDGTNGTPRTGTTTRGKQIVTGVKYIIAMTEV